MSDFTTSPHFPDCEIARIPQHHYDTEKDRWTPNPEWLELRRGVLTATDFGMWLLQCTTAKAKAAKENAISNIVAGVAELWEPEQRFVKEEMERGLKLEPQAVAAFERFSGQEVESVGFCRSIHGFFGCSPDGLLKDSPAGLEGKVPLPSTHIKYRRAGELPSQYKLQVHGSMAVTGAKQWWFQSWNPKLANFRICVERDDFTEALFSGLKAFSQDVEIALEEERMAWEQEFGKEAA